MCATTMTYLFTLCIFVVDLSIPYCLTVQQSSDETTTFDLILVFLKFYQSKINGGFDFSYRNLEPAALVVSRFSALATVVNVAKCADEHETEANY